MISTNRAAVAVFWFRRDLRLVDNVALSHALGNSKYPVLPIFIFDKRILSNLPDRDDARITFIHNILDELNERLRLQGSSLLTKLNTPIAAFREILEEYDVKTVYCNSDYEPYARERDLEVQQLLECKGIPFHSSKDHVVFEKNEVVKSDHKPYTVFTPYQRSWLAKLEREVVQFDSETRLENFYKRTFAPIPSLKHLGFVESSIEFPGREYKDIIANYSKTRDFPALRGTTHIGVHLRFGTLSIRQVLKDALTVADKTWLSELIWRDFYAMILWHFPWTVHSAFKPDYDNIQWRNNETEFRAWCEGRTGYPLVDAGMRELNATGFMHNRVRMVVASFLTKHLLIDWRWGESYFARKLLDYDQASNVGGWQWAAGSGNDAAPYFRIFNPELQTKRFDLNFDYIRKWVPEFQDRSQYPAPIIDHPIARERALKVYREALAKNNSRT